VAAYLPLGLPSNVFRKLRSTFRKDQGEQVASSVWQSAHRFHELCVVIPAHNEELLIGRCIRSVLDAGVAPSDVYVVDDCSSDGTAQAAAAFAGVNVLVNQHQLGKLGGLRRAVADAGLSTRYQYLALLDADSHVDGSYFFFVLERFLNDIDTVLVCGAPRSERHNWLTSYRALEYAVTLRAYRAGQDNLGVITVAPGCASTYRTDILSKLDWNGGTLVEDMDLTVQIHRRGLGRIAYAPEAVTHTQDPRHIREYIGQLTRWYSGTWQVMRLHRIPFGGQRIDAEFALLLLEGGFYSSAVLLLPLLLWMWPATVLRVFLFDQALWLGLASVCAISLRRWDILKNLPSFVLIRMINCVVLISTFWLEIVRNKKQTQWFSVGRYRESRLNIGNLGGLNA
jgi:cellulose synthase/poly-beta-1,6-N-acetylglucosamine synthase-like glycosyltransferase